MFKFLVIPISVGILAFLGIYFVAPVIESESGIVSNVAGLVLYLSNSYFESMPSLVASYVASLNLAIVALSAGLLLMVVIQLIMLIGAMFIRLFEWIKSWLQKDSDKETVQDLPPIEMDSKFMDSGPTDKVLGRGLDSIDRK